jgi:hypothetical protein
MLSRTFKESVSRATKLDTAMSRELADDPDDGVLIVNDEIAALLFERSEKIKETSRTSETTATTTPCVSMVGLFSFLKERTR